MIAITPPVTGSIRSCSIWFASHNHQMPANRSLAALQRPADVARHVRCGPKPAAMIVIIILAQLTRNARVADPGNPTGQHSMERAVATGTVKWFNPTKGYGFIQPQSGGKDVFVHISALERAGLSNLNEGATVDYDVISDRGKESAGNLKVRK